MISYPKVTLCALSYNTGEFTELTIRSALVSNYPNLEIICIDDGSTDSSARKLEALAKELGFDFYENPGNKGIPFSCNRGLSLATGEYFILIGDDLMLPNRIEGDVDILIDNPSVSFVCGSAKIIGQDSLVLEKYSNWVSESPEGVFQEAPEGVWLNGSRIFTPTATYRTQTLRDLGGWNGSYDYEDRSMFIRFAKEGISGWSRSDVTTLYRRHEGNYSAKFRVNMFQQELRLIEDFMLKITPWKASAKFLIEAHYWMLFLGASASQVTEALSLAGKSSLSWTTRSRLFKVAYLALTFIRKSRYVERNVRDYLRRED
jgi:glycosyltransferase involved in cell wall biosynthesis